MKQAATGLSPLANLEPLTRPHSWLRANFDQLMELQESNRFPHALLLDGIPGTGRLQLALSLARWLLCHQPVEEGNCGTCKACGLSQGLTHPDFFVLDAKDEGKAIGIDRVRSAIGFSAATASVGRRKVLLVTPAETMTQAAFNAFLKCLEEPAPGTIILMVTARGVPIPATIRSRCQRWMLAAPPDDAALVWLSAALRKFDVDLESTELQAAFAAFDRRPLSALAGVVSGAAAPRLALCRALTSAAEPLSADLTSAAAQIDNVALLDTLEQGVRRWIRLQSGTMLQSDAGTRAFSALDELACLRRAQQAGSNPSPELLRFRALRACAALWAA